MWGVCISEHVSEETQLSTHNTCNCLCDECSLVLSPNEQNLSIMSVCLITHVHSCTRCGVLVSEVREACLIQHVSLPLMCLNLGPTEPEFCAKMSEIMSNAFADSTHHFSPFRVT